MVGAQVGCLELQGAEHPWGSTRSGYFPANVGLNIGLRNEMSQKKSSCP